MGGFSEAVGGKVIQPAMVNGIKKELNIPALTADSLFNLARIGTSRR
ncbi:MAG: hypothetical protein WCH20_08305 [Nitrospira sp.]